MLCHIGGMFALVCFAVDRATNMKMKIFPFSQSLSLLCRSRRHGVTTLCSLLVKALTSFLMNFCFSIGRHPFFFIIKCVIDTQYGVFNIV